VLWRRESLHERLAREGGLTDGAPPSELARPAWDKSGIHGVHRPREWDAVVTVDVEAAGDSATFVALPDGTLLLESDAEVDLDPFADALEGAVEAPYRAEAVRRTGNRWAVGARRLELIELPEVGGDALSLSEHDGERTLLVDGARTFGSLPPLERRARERFKSYVVEADRLDGDLWEVRITPL
jgi:hypothetical protein